jgi:hypothetical protein
LNIKDFPKLDSPFIRDTINNRYVVTSKINVSFKWIFNKNKVLAIEKLDGTNVSIIVEKGKVIDIYNRKNRIEILSNKKYFRFIDGVNYSLYKELFKTNKSGQFFGELIGPAINENPYDEIRNIWIPFSYLKKNCKFGFWNKFLEQEIENKDLTEKEIFNKISNIFKDLRSIYYEKNKGKKILAEGMIFYNKETGDMCKLRRDMFDWYKGVSHNFFEIKVK